MRTITTSPRSAVRRLALARLISVTGGAAAVAALNLSIYQRTHSAAWPSASLLLTFGAGIVGFGIVIHVALAAGFALGGPALQAFGPRGVYAPDGGLGLLGVAVLVPIMSSPRVGELARVSGARDEAGLVEPVLELVS